MLLQEVEAEVQQQVKLLGDGEAVEQTGMDAVVAAVVGVIVSTILPGAIRNGTGTVAGIYPVSISTNVEDGIVETVGLVATQPVRYIEQNVTRHTSIVEVGGSITAILVHLGPVAVTQGRIVASPGSTLELLKVTTKTQTQKG